MLLAIDTATRTLSLALHDGQNIIAEHTWQSPNRHTVELTPAIRQMLAQADSNPTALTAVAVAQGPGSFSGLRIGISTAKALAFSLNIPLIAVPTLDILAAQQPPPIGDSTLIAVAQAGRGRIVVDDYRWQADRWTSQKQARIVSWAALLESIDSPTLISGEIDATGHDLLATNDKPISVANAIYNLRRAGTLAELAWRAGDLAPAETVAPFYLHQPGMPHP